MADTITFPELGRRVEVLQKQLDGRGLKELTTAVAVKTKGDPQDAAKADGALSKTGTPGEFSHWKGNWPNGQMAARYNQWEQKPGVFEVVPAGRSKGPWRVAQDGRRAGQSATWAPTLTKTGKVSKAKKNQRRAWSGSSTGFGTWDDAEKLMAARVPLRVQVQVSKMLGRVFKG